MTNIVVIDANIALKWVLKEEDSDIAVALLTEWSNREVVVLAPALLIYEAANVLYQNVRRGKITLERAQEALKELIDMELRYDFLLTADLSARAMELAYYFKLPATYDPHYLALAEREGCELWTADTRMWRVVKRELDWVHWIEELKSRSDLKKPSLPN
jgi:predicted nucleic acid-binding protein